jgi:hypothetical protein
MEIGAEVVHHAESHPDVGFGDKFADDAEVNGIWAGRGGHQQAAEELAADISLDGCGSAAEGASRAVDSEGWAA